MTYLRCGECGFTAVRGRVTLVGTCPRCRKRGRRAHLTEFHGPPSSLPPSTPAWREIGASPR